MKNLANNNLAQKLVISLFLLILVWGMLFAMPNVFAQNSNVKILLSEDSVFCTDGDVIAFSNGNNLSIAKDDVVYESQSPLSTKAKDIVIFGEYIVVLNLQNKLESFHFDGQKLIKDNGFFDTIQWTYNSLDIVLGIYSNSDFFYAFGKLNDLPDASHIYAYSKNASPTILCNYYTSSVLDDFAVIQNNVFALSQNKLYKLKLNTTNLENCLVSEDYSFNSLDSSNDMLYLNTNSAIVQFNPTANTFTNMGNSPYPQGKIDYVSSPSPYIFVDCKADLSIKQYAIVDNQIKYINSFDNTIYQAPEVFNIIRIAKANANLDIYVSPKTLLPVMQATKDSYIIVLAEKENYYYVTNGTGKYGYIAKDSALTLIEPMTDTKFGVDVCVLHPNTPLYSLPFDSSPIVARKSINDRLVLINRLAVENGNDVWGWCTVSYTDDNNNVITAYVPVESLAPYTPLTPPDLKKSAKVKVDKFGTLLDVHALPSSDSKVVNQLVDGTEIKLLEKFNPKSEWTMIMIGDQIGYVKTSNVLTSGLTSVQVFIITIVSIVVVATIIILTILLIKRRQNKY